MRFALSLICLVSLGFALAADPCVSGVKPGKRPNPYSSILSTGPERGKSHCFICATENRPAVIVFARSLSDPLGKLVQGLDKALETHKAAELRSWVTFLSDDQTRLDPEVVKWGQKHAIGSVPLGVYTDADGPPSYKIAADADVTVMVYVDQEVRFNFAFRDGELTEAKIDEVLKSVPKIIPPTAEKKDAKTDKK